MPLLGQVLANDRSANSPGTVVDFLIDAFSSALFALLAWPLAILLATMMLARDDWIFHTPHKAMKAPR
jgi:hypothetical protein